MASLLVIGGSGFFGKSILDAYKRGLLSAWGISSISVLARNASKLTDSNPELMHQSIFLIDADISTCTSLPKADYIIHAAASSDAINYLNHPEVEKRNIQAGIYNFCSLIKQTFSKSKIVYCSSGAIYGQQPPQMFKLLETFESSNVSDLVKNKQDYAAAKKDAELAIKKLGEMGFPVSIARCFAFVGPYLPRNQHFAVGNFIEDGLRGRSIEVMAEHMVFRSYMYVDDLVVWLMTIASSASPECPVFNVGSNNAIEIKDLAVMIAEKFRVSVKSSSQRNEEKIDRYVPDTLKARRELALGLEYDLDSALNTTIERLRFRD